MFRAMVHVQLVQHIKTRRISPGSTESTESTGSIHEIHEVHHVFQAAPVGRSLSEVHGHLEVRTGKVTKTQSDSLRIDSIDVMQKVE